MLVDMTTDTITNPTTRLTAPFGEDDPRWPFGGAVALGTAVISAVRPDQLTLPTPCDELDVRGLLGHLVFVLDRVAAMGRGDDLASVEVRADVPDDGWRGAWLAAAHGVQAAWTDDAVLARTIRLPWDDLTGAAVMAVYTAEVAVHTWDLARATNQRPRFDDDVVRVGLEAMRAQLPEPERAARYEETRSRLPEGQRDFAPPFADAVRVAKDAPLIDRLVAWTGRRP